MEITEKNLKAHKKCDKNNKKSSTKLNRDDIAFFYEMDSLLPALSYLLLCFALTFYLPKIENSS